MEDVKWLLRRCGLPILLLLIFVIAGVFCWGKLHAEKQKVAEEVWEPPVEIENSEAETEEAENAEISTESAYWFIPQASDDLLSEKEKEQLQSTVLSAAESVREIYKDRNRGGNSTGRCRNRLDDYRRQYGICRRQ